MALSLGTLEFPQTQLGDFMLILWRLLAVYLLCGLHLLLCWWHRLFHTSQTPPNQQIMPHRGNWNGHPQLLLTAKWLHTLMRAVVWQHKGMNRQKAFLWDDCWYWGCRWRWGLIPVARQDLTGYTYLLEQHRRQLESPDSSSASLQYSSPCFLKIYLKPVYTRSSLGIITLEASTVLPKNALPFATAEATKSSLKNMVNLKGKSVPEAQDNVNK